MTVRPWKLDKLREYVKGNFSQPELYISQINSIDRTVEIFIYHMSSAKKLIDNIEPQNEEDHLDLIFTPKDKRLDLEEAKLGIQAETQATVHNARSIHDMFSQIANSLLLSPPIEIRKCNISNLTYKLPQSKLKDYLNEMLDTEAYLYVNSFLNTIKHRNLVMLESKLDLQEGRGGVQFQGFKFGKNKFSPLWAIQVIEKALEVKNRVVKAGNLLNAELGILNIPKV